MGRFTSMDPLAEKYYGVSPYAFCAGNPIYYVDPDGMEMWSTSDPSQIASFLQQLQANNHNLDDMSKYNMKGWTDKKEGDYTIDTDKKALYYTEGSVNNQGEAVITGKHINLGQESSSFISDIGLAGSWGDAFTDRVGEILKNRGAYFPEGKIPSSVDLPITIKTPVVNVNKTSKVLKAAKIGGKVVAVAGVVVTGVQAYDEAFNQGKTAKAGARLGVTAVAIGAAWVPVVGWGGSLGIGVADYVWGDDFYNWVDKKIGGN